MKLLEKRLRERNLKLLSKEAIGGPHAGTIYRIVVLDEVKNQRVNYIYKEFATDRTNEVELYKTLAAHIKPLSKTVKVYDSPPQALLLDDLNSPVKKTFNQLSLKAKKVVIDSILKRLIEVHRSNPGQVMEQLPIHHITSEWRDWCLNQMKRLCLTTEWADPEWMYTINYSYNQLKLPNYIFRCSSVLTHGDPHMENIFYQNGQVWFIDWEWAAMGSPLRDVTILLQDLYDHELIHYVKNSYWGYVQNTINKEDYNSDFNCLYIDHLTMMLAWEIEKYWQGYTSEDRIRSIIDFKIGEVERITNEQMTGDKEHRGTD